ncbi:hypothetical protein Ac2012v2_002550 [Leucoagaricus gongylophorus]
MKSRKSFLTLIIPSRRHVALGSKLKLTSDPAENMAIASANEGLKDNEITTAVGQKTDDMKPTIKKHFDERPRSKSKRILRAISTTFRPRFPQSPTSPPPASVSPQAKQNREAALRERGLLPAKDLSRQEADQDRRNPVISPDRDSIDNSSKPSAAQIIRQEWEIQNTTSAEVRERERMKSFRFGVPLSASASASSPNLSRSPQPEMVAEVNVPLCSPVLSPASVNDAQRQALSQQSSASAEQPLATSFSSVISSSTPPKKPLITSPDPTLVSSAGVNNLPCPSSSKCDSVDHAPNSNRHKRWGSHHSTSSAPPSANPIISLTPPGQMSSFSRSSSMSSSAHRRSDSLTRLPSISESSMMTPSLDYSSRSSTLNTTDSLSVGGRHKGRNGLFIIKMPEHFRSVPMIVESPVEEALVFDTNMTSESTPLPMSSSVGLSPTPDVSLHHPVLTRRERGFVDTGQREKRKSFNPFKRGQSAAPSDGSDRNYKRLSISTSIGNLRKSASGWTVGRSSHDVPSTAPVNGTFDASHLPPSPKLPKQFRTSTADTASTGVSSQRRSVQPTLHTHGSIIHETNAIKNDEVRRVTELAFLG